MSNINEIKLSGENQSYRTLHKLSEGEKNQGSIFTKQFDSMVVTYKDFNNDGYITENEISNIKKYSAYTSTKGETITVVREEADLDGDGKVDLNTRTRVKNGKIIDLRKLPLEWANDFVEDARAAWCKDIDFTEYE